MARIGQDLYRFGTYNPEIDLSFNQYLLATDEPILFHTGSIQQAAALVLQLKAALGGQALRYIFISHFESDECGGLPVILEEYPEALAICSEVTARQLLGFGYKAKILQAKSGETLETNAYDLHFLHYPAEMHLWEGLLVYERRRGIFFSSDLMIRRGDADGVVIDTDWKTEVGRIGPDQIPAPDRLDLLQKTLAQFTPKLVATGHGPILQLG